MVASKIIEINTKKKIVATNYQFQYRGSSSVVQPYRPPKEATTSKIWKLRKAVYGLAGANCTWYLKIRKELIKFGAIVSKINQGIFYWKEKSKLKGIAICFVDDLVWVGNKNFEAIIAKLKETFQIGIENTKMFLLKNWRQTWPLSGL